MNPFKKTECGKTIRAVGRDWQVFDGKTAKGGIYDNEDRCVKEGKKNGTIKPDSTARR